MSEAEKVTMRTPFPTHQISKLPKPTKAQTDEVKADFRKGIRCKLCGAWHHPDVVHLDYVGHAALTDRMLDVDPAWNWDFVALNPDGTPVLDENGGMWIRLTINGVTRLGYGDAQDKTGGNAMKERIGDALRNAAMRFGAALDLWHKGDLHLDTDPTVPLPPNNRENKNPPTFKEWKAVGVERQKKLIDSVVAISDALDIKDDLAAAEQFYDHIQHVDDNCDQNEAMKAVWSCFGSGDRSRITKANDERNAEAKAA
jgi:hypothetical protein